MPASLDKPEENLGKSPLGITFGGRKYTVGSLALSGAFCEFYSCEVPAKAKTSGHTWYDLLTEDDEPTTQGILKVSDVDNNDFLANEARILAKLFPKDQDEVKFYRYLPRLLDHFTLPSGCAASVFEYVTGYVSLADVIKAFPSGIDFRDMVWMFKRTLVGIGFAHKNGVVCGSVLPSHVLVHPTEHGAKLMDWSFAVEAGDHLHAISGGFRDYYPPEVFEKEKALPATDIYMAAKCAVALLGGNVKTNEIPTLVPEKIRYFFYKCLVKNASRRPQDAWDLHVEFDKLLQEIVGKPTYRKLVMP